MHKTRFATGGYGDGQPMGETITMNGPTQQDTYHYNQKKFVEGGYGKGEDVGETISMKGPEQMDTYHYIQTSAKDVRGEKEWQTWAQDLEDYGIKQEDAANTRLPYASTLVQTEIPTGAMHPTQTKTPPVLGEYDVRGEKEHQQWAQDLEDYGIQQETVANTRLPYASTFVQTEAKDVRGEKEWQTWAQDLEDYGIKQEEAANTRIPYASTLLQTKDVRGEKEW